jgi:hypothetical protein
MYRWPYSQDAKCGRGRRVVAPTNMSIPVARLPKLFKSVQLPAKYNHVRTDAAGMPGWPEQCGELVLPDGKGENSRRTEIEESPLFMHVWSYVA